MTPSAERRVTGLLGAKLGMTQVWDAAGRLVPVTVVQVPTNVVTQVRTPERDGYSAVQLAFGQVDPRRVTQPLTGHFTAAGTTPRRHVAEVRTADASSYSLGQELTAELFSAGQTIDVVGTTRGKGTAGEKIKAMEAAGVLMAASPTELGTTLQAALKRGPRK